MAAGPSLITSKHFTVKTDGTLVTLLDFFFFFFLLNNGFKLVSTSTKHVTVDVSLMLAVLCNKKNILSSFKML